jgi:hypothetical protein
MCEFPLDPQLPCGLQPFDWHMLMALAGLAFGFILWKAIYDAFLN